MEPGKLTDEFSGNTNQDLATLMIKIFRMRLKDKSPVEDAKNHFEDMIDKNLRLKEIDDDRSFKGDIIAVLLCIYPPAEMEQIKLKRLSGPLKPTVVRDDVISFLRRMAVTEDGTKTLGTAMNTRGGDGGSRGRNGFKGKCYNCDKVGHRESDCRMSKRKNTNGGANIAITVALAGANMPRASARDWTMDGSMKSGHIECVKAVFGNTLQMFTENERPTISGVGGQKIQIHGRGKVTLRGELARS